MQWVKGSGIAAAAPNFTAVAQIQSLVLGELPHVTDAAIKKKEEEEEESSSNYVITKIFSDFPYY